MPNSANKRRRPPKEPKQPGQISDSERAGRFIRPLKWLNRVLDSLISIIEDHLVVGTPISGGTRDLIQLLIEYKKRAIREGFESWFPEGGHNFLVYYQLLENLDRELELAKKLADEKNACRVQLGKADRAKYLLMDKFPEYLTLPFVVWFQDFYDLDKALERIDSAVKFNHASLDDVSRAARLMKGQLNALAATANDAILNGATDITPEWLNDLSSSQQQLDSLLDQLANNDFDLDKPADRAAIRRVLSRVRRRKYQFIRRFGAFGDNALADWYKALFEIDYEIDNAADLWVDGQKLGDWDGDEAKKRIEEAERAKIRLIRKFPDFLDKDPYWYYIRLYKMDMSLSAAENLLRDGQDLDALIELRKVSRPKHQIEAHLETF